jgi:hypothetical protein
MKESKITGIDFDGTCVTHDFPRIGQDIGATDVVARKLNRNYLGFELNPEYVNIANRKLNRELGIYK